MPPAGDSLTLPCGHVMQRGNLGSILLAILGRPPSPSLSFWSWCLLPLAAPWIIDLPHRDEAVPLDGLYGEAAARGGAADSGAQPAGALPLHERHPHRLASSDLGEESGHGGVGLARFLLLKRVELLLGQWFERSDLDSHSVSLMAAGRACAPHALIQRMENVQSLTK
jgi:hypothetical protein